MVRQVIVPPQPVHSRRRRGVGEVAGGGAAECAAVCCCCPCAVIHLAVLAVYKVPKRLILKAARKRRRHLLNKNNSNNVVVVGNMGNDILVSHPHRASSVNAYDSAVCNTRLEQFLKQLSIKEQAEEEEGLEKEMWARFAGTGFWRSESQRQP